MPAGSDFIFAIQDKAYNFWQLDDAGRVIKNAQPYFLDFAPDGWDGISLSNIRNRNYWGIDRTVTIPLNYVRDGAKILKHIFYTLGIEESCYLSISNQHLFFNKIWFTRGGTTLIAGKNSGIITGTPGDIINLRFTVNTAGLGDSIVGKIGNITVGIIASITDPNPVKNITFTIPDSGQVDFDFTFTNLSGNATVDFTFTNGASAAYGYWYKQIYRGEIDLSTFNHAGAKVTCTTLEDGLAKYLKANENTLFEFPLNVPRAVNVKMDGINLLESLNYQQLTELEIKLTDYAINPTIPVTFFTPTIYVSREGDSVGVLESSQTLEDTLGDTLAEIVASDNCLIENLNTGSVTFEVSGRMEFICTVQQVANYALKLRFLTSGLTDVTQNDFVIFNAKIDKDQVYTQDYSFTISLAPNEKLFLDGTFYNLAPELPPGNFPADIGIKFTDRSHFKAAFITRQNSTEIKAFTLQHLFELLIDKVTDGAYKAAVSPFCTRNKKRVITSGNGIRGLADATLQISFATFFKFCNCIDSVGISETGKTINLDSKQYLLDPVNVIDLPEVGEGSLKVTVAKEYLFNEINIGYPELKNDVGVLNGNEEFNTKFVFSLGATKNPAVLDKVSPVKASPYEIEKIRVTTLEKNSTDYKADNDNFVLEIEDTQPKIASTPQDYTSTGNRITLGPVLAASLKSGYKIGLNGKIYTVAQIIGTQVTLLEQIGNGSGNTIIDVYGPFNLDRSLNATATGLTEKDTVFNIGLSPKRLFIANGPFIRSSLYLADDKTFRFISADKNNKLEAAGVVERADVNVGSLGPKFFVPVLFDFNIQAPDNLEDLLDTNPLRLFRFPFNGDTYTGILIKVGLSPSNRKEQTFQLLSTADNKLTNLIEYYGG